MADTQLYSEIVHTIVNGFVTTKAPQIDALYRRFNTTFDEEDQFLAYLKAGINCAVQEVAGSERELHRMYMFQTLVLIFVEREFDLGLKRKAEVVAPEVATSCRNEPVDLAILIDGLRDPESHPGIAEFVDATKGTNVAHAKAVRFLYLDAAV